MIDKDDSDSVSDRKIQSGGVEIRGIVHAAKLLTILRGKQAMIEVQLAAVRQYLKENS